MSQLVAVAPFRWRDAERLIVFGRGAMAQRSELLETGYALLTTPRAAASAPELVAAAAVAISAPMIPAAILAPPVRPAPHRVAPSRPAPATATWTTISRSKPAIFLHSFLHSCASAADIARPGGRLVG